MMDFVADLSSPAAGKDDLTATIDKLCELFTVDNVHLTTLGYARLAGGTAGAVSLANKKQNTADCMISGEKQRFFWRGFTSAHGGKRSSHSASLYTLYRQRAAAGGGPARGTGRQQGNHPYRGLGGHRDRRFYRE